MAKTPPGRQVICKNSRPFALFNKCTALNLLLTAVPMFSAKAYCKVAFFIAIPTITVSTTHILE